jgi:hypothetical protein
VNLRSNRPSADAVAAGVRAVLADRGFAGRSAAIGEQIAAYP